MLSHGEHMVVSALGYFLFLYGASLWCSRRASRDALQAIQREKRSNPSRWSGLFASVVVVSLPLFIFGLWQI